MFGQNAWQQPQQPVYGAWQQPQQMYQQSRMDFLQGAQQPQQGGLQARPVTGREEAVAATVFPGNPMLFLDRANGAVYYKAVDPQTGAAEFVDFAIVPHVQAQPAPQYATLADVEAIRAEMMQIREMIPSSTTRRTKGADAE